MKKTRVVALALLVLAVATACGRGSTEGGSSSESAPTPEPDAPAMYPVSVNQGLASLDSYRMTYTVDTFDSASQIRSVATFVVAHDQASDATYTRNETTTTIEGGGEGEAEVQEQYAIGNRVCSLNLGEAEFTTISDPAKVMMDIMGQSITFSPQIEDPVYVRDETVNGVPVRTYSFELSSITAASDVEAEQADGSYSIAVDGDYLVHYLLDLDLRTGAEGEAESTSSVMHMEVSLEQINQPVQIEFPPECLAAESIMG